MFNFLDILFLVFHTMLIVFNLFGWIWKKTRKINLVTLLLTGFSWLGLGLFYGWGYCFLTDWHWRVLEKLGESSTADSYIQYLINRILGLQIASKLADYITVIPFVIAIIVSFYFNLRKTAKA